MIDAIKSFVENINIRANDVQKFIKERFGVNVSRRLNGIIPVQWLNGIIPVAYVDAMVAHPTARSGIEMFKLHETSSRR